MARGNYRIPFDATGSLLAYASEGELYGDHGFVWRDNYVFEAVLSYDSFGRGRSSATINWADAEGRIYPMFLKDLDALLRQTTLTAGRVSACWTFVKRGRNYGLCLAPGWLPVTVGES